MDPVEQFEAEKKQRVAEYADDTSFQELSRSWLMESMKRKYVYNFSWMGRPIIQNPIDIVGLQELIWQVRPDVIVETGIAHGGSLVFSASMLELIGHGEVIGVDIEIRKHNREAIESHPMSRRITMIEGSSIDPGTVAQVKRLVDGKSKIMVLLDSNHTKDHVLAELNAYAPLVSVDSYCIVYDSFVEDMPENFFPDRPWDVGNNPKPAIWEWLKVHPEFVIDRQMENKLMITVAPDGFLKRIR